MAASVRKHRRKTTLRPGNDIEMTVLYGRCHPLTAGSRCTARHHAAAMRALASVVDHHPRAAERCGADLVIEHQRRPALGEPKIGRVECIPGDRIAMRFASRRTWSAIAVDVKVVACLDG